MKRLCRWLPHGLAPLVLLLLLSPVLTGHSRLAFRDVSHFYTPLYQYLAQRSKSQWLPLWNPLDQTGIPLIGETTTAFFYPPRYVLFSLPLSAETLMGWYVALHLLLACWTASFAARRFGASPIAATIAGLTYALSGGVASLYCNPPFLVGAAWLPLALTAWTARSVEREKSVRCLFPRSGPLGALQKRYRTPISRLTQKAAGIFVGGPVLAMMVLGGDPQTALNSVLIVAGIWLVQAIRGRAAVLKVSLTPVMASACLAAVLAAPQLAASISWSSHSDRLAAKQMDRATASDDLDAVPTAHRPQDQHWWDAPQRHTRRHEAFQFSLPPWHLAELVTPMAFGSLLPQNHRLSLLIPGEGRVWTPTIYLGIMGLIAIVMQLRCRGRHALDCWFVIGLTGLLLSFGHFGLLWLVQNLTGRLANVDSSIGGAYWWLYQFVPGYDAFRYPSKWLPVFSLGIALITARASDLLASCRIRVAVPVRRISLWITAGILLLAAAGWFAAWYLWQPAIRGIPLPHDVFWGPLLIEDALLEVGRSLVQSVIVFAMVVLLLGWAGGLAGQRQIATITSPKRQRVIWRNPFTRLRVGLVRWLGQFTRSKHQSRQLVLSCLAVVVAVDLGLSANRFVVHVPIETEKHLVSVISASGTANRWLRTQSSGGWPDAWMHTQSDQRLLEVESSQRAAWLGRWHLAERQAVFNNMVSIQSAEMALFWRALDVATAELNVAGKQQLWRQVKLWLMIDGEHQATGQTNHVQLAATRYQLADLRRQQQPAAEKPFRWDGRWRISGEQRPSLSGWLAVLGQVAKPASESVPTLTGVPDSVAASGRTSVGTAGGIEHAAAKLSQTQAVPSSNDEGAIRVHSRQAGLLSRPVYQDGHWIAEIKPVAGQHWRPLPVVQVDYLLQGVILPPGNFDVRFRYRPSWLWPSLVLSAMGWLLLVAYWLSRARGRLNITRR